MRKRLAMLMISLSPVRFKKILKPMNFFLCGWMLFCTSLCIAEEIKPKNKGWDSIELASLYHHNSFMQMEWAWNTFFESVHLAGNERIFDYGSGDGKIPALLSKIVKNGEVIGVDVSDQMVDFASFLYPKNKYPNLSFETIDFKFSSSSKFTNAFGIVTSFCVFHFVDEPSSILKELFDVLKDDGKLVLISPAFRLDDPFMKTSRAIMEKHGIVFPKRSEDNFLIHKKDPNQFQNFVKNAGFSINVFEIVESKYPYTSLQDLADWIEGTWSGNVDLPASKRKQIAREVAEKYVETHPQAIDQQGRILLTAQYIKVVAEKKRSLNFPDKDL